ncbi:KH domain-containing protein [Patescibacteria group bacterium]|nr:KH domain-containing protein [Patescibacteria group bacterium]
MAGKIKSDKIKKEAQTFTTKLLKLIGVDGKVEAEVDEELIKIMISGEDLGLLIGYRGENLESLQLVLGIALNKRLSLDPRMPVIVDVGGWRQQQEESLRSLVEKEIANISSVSNSVELPPMPPTQRRSVHLLVKNYEGLTSESTGEEPNRRIVIKKIK